MVTKTKTEARQGEPAPGLSKILIASMALSVVFAIALLASF